MADTKKYWKGIEELEQAPEFVESSKKEFSEYVPVDEFVGNASEDSSPTNRRDFLKVLGFSVTAATLAACEAPVTKSIPFLNFPVFPITPLNLICVTIFFFFKKENIFNPYRIFELI